MFNFPHFSRKSTINFFLSKQSLIVIPYGSYNSANQVEAEISDISLNQYSSSSCSVPIIEASNSTFRIAEPAAAVNDCNNLDIEFHIGKWLSNVQHLIC